MFSDDHVSHYAVFEFIERVVRKKPCQNLIPFLGNSDYQNQGLNEIGDGEAALFKTSKHGSKLLNLTSGITIRESKAEHFADLHEY